MVENVGSDLQLLGLRFSVSAMIFINLQVRIVLEERKRFSNELEILKSTKFGFYSSSKLDGPSEPCQADEMLAEIIRVSSERELLKREVTEMNDRIEMLEKSARQSELDNEKLAYKVRRVCKTCEGVIALNSIKMFLKKLTSLCNR